MLLRMLTSARELVSYLPPGLFTRQENGTIQTVAAQINHLVFLEFCYILHTFPGTSSWCFALVPDGNMSALVCFYLS